MLQPWLRSLREFCSQRSVLHECFLTFASTEAVLERGKALTELMPLTALKHTQRTQKQTPRCSQSSLQGSGLHCCSWDTTCALGELGQAGVHEVPRGRAACSSVRGQHNSIFPATFTLFASTSNSRDLLPAEHRTALHCPPHTKAVPQLLAGVVAVLQCFNEIFTTCTRHSHWLQWLGSWATFLQLARLQHRGKRVDVTSATLIIS